SSDSAPLSSKTLMVSNAGLPLPARTLTGTEAVVVLVQPAVRAASTMARQAAMASAPRASTSGPSMLLPERSEREPPRTGAGPLPPYRTCALRCRLHVADVSFARLRLAPIVLAPTFLRRNP